VRADVRHLVEGFSDGHQAKRSGVLRVGTEKIRGKEMSPDQMADFLEDVLGRSKSAVERQLAAQGDHAEPDLIQLQHDLAELLRPRASQNTAAPTSETK
jgi:hypothetical protein